MRSRQAMQLLSPGAVLWTEFGVNHGFGIVFLVSRPYTCTREESKLPGTPFAVLKYRNLSMTPMPPAKHAQFIQTSQRTPSGDRLQQPRHGHARTAQGSAAPWGRISPHAASGPRWQRQSSGAAVLSIQEALIEIRAPPPCLRKRRALRATILAWSGWATSAKITSTAGRLP